MSKSSTSSRLSFEQGGNHLKIGLIGITNVGKSSLFNVLSGSSRKEINWTKNEGRKNISALVGSRLFTTIDPNLTSFTLSDYRLDYLRELYKDHRDVTDTLQAVGGGTRVSLLDTKGILAGSNSIRKCFAPVNVFLHVLRGFTDKDLTHFEETIDPLRDYRTANKEMKAQDLLRIEDALKDLRPRVEAHTGGTDTEFEYYTLIKAWEILSGVTYNVSAVLAPMSQSADKSKNNINTTNGKGPLDTAIVSTVHNLSNGRDIRQHVWNGGERDVLVKYQLLTAKPVILVLNVSTWDYLRGPERNVWHKKMQELSLQEGCPLVTMSLAFECQRLETISKMSGSQEKGEDSLSNANPTHKSAALHLLYESVRVLELLQVYSVNISSEKVERVRASGISSTEGNELQVSTFLVPQGIGGTIEDLCKLSHGVETSRMMRNADVINYDTIMEYQGDIIKARLQGQLKSSNKTYMLADGDVVSSLT